MMREDVQDDKTEMGGRHAMFQSLIDDPVPPGQDNSTSAASGGGGGGGGGAGLPQVA